MDSIAEWAFRILAYGVVVFVVSFVSVMIEGNKGGIIMAKLTEPIYQEAQPATRWARCLSCDFVGLKTEFKAAQTGPDSYTPTCPACHSDDVVVL